MKDWSKYVFDPKNPKDFKAYKLLKKIFKDGNTTLVTDIYYFNELFKKEIWTQDVIDELWDDLPENFSELSSNEKADIYIQQYSRQDYIDRLIKNISFIKESKYYGIFSKFIQELKIGFLPISNEVESYILKESNEIDVSRINQFTIDLYYSKLLFTDEEDEISNFPSYNSSSCFFFIKENFSYQPREILKKGMRRNVLPYDFMDGLNLERTSVFFIDQTVIEDEGFSSILNLHPIILKKDEDIHQLLDFIIRDLNNENQVKSLHQPKTYLNEITIKNYFSIENISIKNLGKKKEIYLMGENGDGKTILLQAIVLALRGNQNIGAISDIVKQNTHEKMSLFAQTSDGKKYTFSENPKNQKNSFSPVLGYGIDRFRNDSDKIDKVGYLSLFDKETYLENPEKWLQHLDYKETKGDTSEISLSQAKEVLIDILEREVSIDVTPDKVTFTEKGTTLNFSQLSDGYQSVIIWVCDLIARLSTLQPNVSSTHDYSGVVILDEIGAYLHPKWAYEIVKKLREWFPNLQFIFTTHNPIVILGASEDAAFYKVYKEEGKTKISEPVEDISDLMLNSLVTSPLFNLPTARPKGFDDSNDLSSDDYIYRRIHQLIQEKLQKMPDLVDEDVMKMIEAELEKN